MNNTIRNLFLLTILLSGTQVISPPFGGLSIFQISLLITVFVALLGIIRKRTVRKGIYLFVSFVWVVSSVVAWLVSINPSWANSYFLLGLMTSFFILLFPSYFDRNDVFILEKTLIRSQYIVLPFSIYFYYMFYTNGGVPNHLDLFGGFYIDLDDDTLTRGQAASLLRLMLPYSTPPVLSLVMAMCVIMLLSNKDLYSKIMRYFLLLSYSLVLIMTGSRTGFIGLCLFAVVHLILKMLSFSREKSAKYFVTILGVMIIAIIVFPFLSDVVYIQKMFINRTEGFSCESLMSDRHFTVPLDGFLIWISSIQNFLIGIGFGSSLFMTGEHTFLPPYFLNSFITLLAERGLMGLLLCIFLISLSVSLYSKRAMMNYAEKSLTYAFIVGMLSCVFYEGINCYFFIFVMSISFMVNVDFKINRR